MESVHGQMDVQDGRGLAAGSREALVFLPQEKHSAFVCGKQRCCRVGTLAMQDTEGLSYRQEAARFRVLSEHIPCSKSGTFGQSLSQHFSKEGQQIVRGKFTIWQGCFYVCSDVLCRH